MNEPNLDSPLRLEQQDFLQKLKSYERQGTLGFTIYEGPVRLPDWRMLKLPLARFADGMERVDQLYAQYDEYLRNNPGSDLRSVNVRFLWGAKLPSYGAVMEIGPLESLWYNSASDIFGRAKGVGLHENEGKRPSFAELIDLQIQHPSTPITIVHGHGVTMPDDPNWNVMITDQRSDEYISHLPFQDVRSRIEELDKHKPSLIILSSCNTQNQTLPNNRNSIVYYSSTSAGMLHSGPLTLKRTAIES